MSTFMRPIQQIEAKKRFSKLKKKEEEEMTKENYEETLEQLKSAQAKLRGEYIETNKPCEIGNYVEIILANGRAVRGWVKEISILSDKKVCVTAYSETDIDNTLKQRYITTPHGQVTIL